MARVHPTHDAQWKVTTLGGSSSLNTVPTPLRRHNLETNTQNQFVYFHPVALKALTSFEADLREGVLFPEVNLFKVNEKVADIRAGSTVLAHERREAVQRFLQAISQGDESAKLLVKRCPTSTKETIVTSGQVSYKPRETWTMADVAKFIVLNYVFTSEQRQNDGEEAHVLFLQFFNNEYGTLRPVKATLTGSFVVYDDQETFHNLIIALTKHSTHAESSSIPANYFIDIFSTTLLDKLRKNTGGAELRDMLQLRYDELYNKGRLSDAIRSFENRVLVTNSISSPFIPKDLEKIYQAYHCMRANIRFDIVMLADRVYEDLRAIVDVPIREETLLYTFFSNFDPTYVFCKSIDDRETVTKALCTDADGFANVKYQLENTFRAWFQDISDARQQSLVEEQNGSQYHKLEKAVELLGHGIILSYSGSFGASEMAFQLALDILKGLEPIVFRGKSKDVKLTEEDVKFNNQVIWYRCKGHFEMAECIVLKDRRKVKQALELLEEAERVLVHCSDAQQKNDLAQMGAKCNGLVLTHARRFDDAIDKYYAMYNRAEEDEDPMVMAKAARVSLLYSKLLIYTQEKEYYEIAKDTCKKAFKQHLYYVRKTTQKNSDVFMTDITLTTGELYLKLNKFEKAGMALEKSRVLAKKHIGVTNLKIIKIFRLMADAQRQGHKFSEALKTCEKAMDVMERLFHDSSSYMCQIYNLKGRIYEDQEKLDDAESNYQLAFEYGEQAADGQTFKNRKRLAKYAGDLEKIYRRRGKEQKANNMLKRKSMILKLIQSLNK